MGLEIEETSQKSEAIISVKIALKELWGLDEITAQKIMGIIITLVVEISIFILALFSTKGRNKAEVLTKPKLDKELLTKIHCIFGEKPVKKFFDVSLNYMKKYGKLPPLRSLNKEIRPVRLFLNEYYQEDLHELFLK